MHDNVKSKPNYIIMYSGYYLIKNLYNLANILTDTDYFKKMHLEILSVAVKTLINLFQKNYI